MRVYAAGPVTEDGGTIIIVEGPADAYVDWSVTGGGALTPTTSRTNENGIASAAYDPTGGTPALGGATVTVEVDCYP